MAKGFLAKFFPRNIGLKTLNHLDLQDRLTDNLKRINRLLNNDSKISNKEFVSEVDDIYKSVKGGEVMGKVVSQEAYDISTIIDDFKADKNLLLDFKEDLKNLDINDNYKKLLDKKINRYIKDIDDYEKEVNTKMFEKELFSKYPASLEKAFNSLDGISKRVKSSKFDKLNQVEFQKSPAYKMFSDEAQEYINEMNLDMSVQELFDEMSDLGVRYMKENSDLDILKPKYSITKKEYTKLVDNLKKGFKDIFPNQKIINDYDEFLRHYNKLKNSGNNNIQFAKKVAEYNTKFNDDLLKLKNGDLPEGYIMNLGEPGSILKASGIPDLQIELSSSLLQQKFRKHNFIAGDVENLPKAIQEPIAVFNSSTIKGRKVIFTEIEYGNKNFTVALELNRVRGALKVNSIRSVHPKEAKQVLNYINKGDGVYFDNKKMSDYLSKQQFNSADVTQTSNISNSISQKIKKAKEIVDNFKNPKFDDGDISFMKAYHGSPYSFDKFSTEHNQFMKKSSGEIYGAKLSDGTIYLNPEKINANTPIHEFSHLWEQTFQKEWKQGVDIFKNSKEGKRYFEALKKDGSYRKLNDNELWNEALNFYIGKKGEFLYNSKLSKIGLWLRNLYKSIQKKFGIKKEITSKTTLKDFTDDVLSDLTAGKSLKGNIGKFDDFDIKFAKSEKKSIIGTENYNGLASEIVKNGGISLKVAGKENIGGKPYIAVSPYPNRSKIVRVKDFNDKTINDYIYKNGDKLFEEGHMLGGWVNDGNVYLDVSLSIPKKYQKEAIKLGKKYNQKAVFDLENFEEINTFGNGKHIDIDEAQILKDIYNITK